MVLNRPRRPLDRRFMNILCRYYKYCLRRNKQCHHATIAIHHFYQGNPRGTRAAELQLWARALPVEAKEAGREKRTSNPEAGECPEARGMPRCVERITAAPPGGPPEKNRFQDGCKN